MYNRTEAFIEGQAKVLEMISANDPLPEILEAIIYWLEDQGSDDMRAAIYLTDEDEKHLLLSAAPNLPDAYNEAVGELVIALGVGSCGTAAYLREQVLVEDIAVDLLWKDYQKVAIAFDLHSCWSIPLIAINGRLLGTLAVYHGYSKKADKEELRLMKLVSRIAVVAIEQSIREKEKLRLEVNERTARAKVNSAEQLAQLAVEGSGAGTFHIRLVDDKLTYSPAFSKILTGTDFDGLERRSFVKYLHPEDFDIRDRAYEEAVITGKLHYEARFIWVDGSVHWVKIRGTYQKDEEGVATDFSGTVQDVTEDKRKEKELQKLQNRFQSIFDNAPLGIALADVDGRFTLVNDAYTSILGYEAMELYSRKIKDITDPRDLTRQDELFGQLLAGHISYFEIEKRNFKKSGKVVWVRSTVSLIKDQNGQPENFIAISEDITSEIEWRQEQQKLRSLIDNSSDLMSVLEADGTNSYLNKAGMDMLGFDNQQQVHETPISQLHAPEDFLQVEKEVLPGILNTGRWKGTMIVRNLKTGEVFPVFNSSIRINDPVTGELMAIGATMRDLRPEYHLQKEQQKLVSLLETSSDFVSLADEDGNVYYVNEAGRKMMGLDSMEDVKRTNRDYVMPSQTSKIDIDVKTALTDNGRWAGEIIYRHFKTGEAIPVYATTMLVFDSVTGKSYGRATVSRDLRKEKAFQKALIESEQRFRLMVKQSYVAMGVLKGANMLIEIANDALLEFWGKGSDVIGLPLAEALPELRHQPFPTLLNEVYRTGIAHHGFETLARIKRNGKMEDCYFNFVYAPFYESSEITGVQVVAAEVTGQIRAKKELEASEERFRNFVMNAPTPIGVYIGREMRIQIANDAILAAWDRDQSVIGKTFREALPELEGQPFYKLLDDVYTTGIPYIAREARVDLLFEGKLKTYYFNFTYKALRDGNGNIYGVMNTAADVTDLVTARQELAKAEGQLRIAINSAELGTWTIDPRSGKAFISERIREWYGLDNDHVDLQAGFIAIHADDRDKVVRKFMETLKPGNDDLYEDEYRVVNLKNKEQRIIRATARVFFDDANEAYLVSGIVQDITKQKMNEQELENQVELRTKELQLANMQLQQSNQELEQFAYVASHDLQEPLRKIRMFSGIMQNHSVIDNDPESRQYFQKIVASANRMTNLIRDLLDFSRVTAKEELFSKVDLNMIVKNVEHDFELLIQQKKASITIHTLPIVEAIALQMNQLFYNLIGNALKFTEEDQAPVINISSRPALREEIEQHTGLQVSKNYQLISISDSGIGFDSFLKEKIFTIFQRLNPRDKYEGTGIGLALCKKIVLAHSGAIWAESTLNKGATFYILLPLNQN